MEQRRDGLVLPATGVLGRAQLPLTCSSPVRQGRLYSVGYEGFTLASFVERVRGLVSTVVDVRLNPVSRRPGFSKKPLSAALVDAGVGYVHERALGNPMANRVYWQPGGDVEVGRDFLRELFTQDGESRAALSRLIERAHHEPVAVLCLERASANCHRIVVTELALTLDPTLEVIEVL